MKRITAVLLSVTLMLSVAACGKKSGSEASEESSAVAVTEMTSDTTETTAVTTEAPDPTTTETTAATTTDTTETTAGSYEEYIGPTRATEAPEYGDGKVAEICELMHSITGKRVYQAGAMIEDYFKTAIADSYLAEHTSYEEDKNGETFYTWICSIKAVSADVEFNTIWVTANEEYGIVHTVDFITSNSKNPDAEMVSDLSQEEMMQYYERIEKDLTACLGPASDSSPLDPSNPFGGAFSEYTDAGECIFKVKFDAGGADSVVITCTNPSERKHFIKDTDHPSETDDSGFVDMGDNYFKEAGPDDIITDEKTGIKYIKNQLLVSVTLGTPDAKKKMEDICADIGAEIVGHIEIVSDFQIEFDRDLTYDELEKIGKELEEQYYFISSVGLNYAVDYGYDDEYYYD